MRLPLLPPLSGGGGRALALPLVLTAFLSCPIPIASEIRTFNGAIDAASSYIHYSEGYLVAPGFVDLSDLVFTTKDDGEDNYEPIQRDDDSEEGDDGTDDLETGGDSDGGGNRTLADDNDTDPFGSTVDIILFHEPSDCARTKNGCDWTQLGIGASDDMGNLRWCCSSDAVDLGFCQGGRQNGGRLIIDATKFTGQHRFVSVPTSGRLEATVNYGKLEEPQKSGKHALVIANCNDAGRDVMVKGHYTWKSKHGYLPGDLFGEMYYYAVLAIFYTILLVWYGVSMKCHEDSIIPIQKWILMTIGMGLLETFFKAGDYWVWNEDGTRFWFAMYTGIILGVVKRAISRCLVVMVSLGWGVIRDTLGDQIRKIVALGALYVGVSGARDVMTIFAITENQTLSIGEEEELYDAVTILTFVEAAINVVFYMWILDALNNTMQYLENMSQNMKLKRYLRLRCILLLSILFAVVWAVFGIVNSHMEESMLEWNQEWAVQGAWELNYLMVLIGVAALWRPDRYAKEYAFVMELPSVGGDIELETNADTIPGPDDDDDEDEGAPKVGFKDTPNGGGYKDDPDGGGLKDVPNGDSAKEDALKPTDALKIDDAVDA